MVRAGMKRIGVTGTHHGGTIEQIDTFRRFLTALMPEYLHEGDCVGFDVQATRIARQLGIFVISHPPTNPKRRAYEPADEVREPKPYMVRDHDIVNETNMLIGCPYTPHEILHSGTWATIRYGIKTRHPVYIIMPDGAIFLF